MGFTDKLFGTYSERQVKKLNKYVDYIESLAPKYKEMSNEELALVNAVVKQAKASEKAYICLRGGWLCRSYMEHMKETGNADQAKIAEVSALETDFLKNAYEGFIAAEQNESFPMCGMDESTLDYLLASLAIRFNHLDVASKLISNLLLSQNVNARVKDKVRDLKDEVIRLQREAKK